MKQKPTAGQRMIESAKQALEFAKLFGLSKRTLEHWEHGRRVPSGPARALLTVIAREPEAVRRALLA
jgi:putative transcriptional regulator